MRIFDINHFRHQICRLPAARRRTGANLRKTAQRCPPTHAFSFRNWTCIYNKPTRSKNTSGKRPLSSHLLKELCFDIDLTDYDDIRTCCDKANICIKCWQFITMAVKVIDVALRDDFGFKHILWVYSGRRGAHAWVCDKKARQMDDQKRRAIAGYLEVIKGGAQGGKKVNVKRPLHSHVAYGPHPTISWS